MKEIIIESFIHPIKLIPFLFLVFLLLEFLEHNMSKKTKKVVEKSGKYGPLLGGILGAFPQCGFSLVATNLYAARVITLGTLISIYLSTSDEMLPILISSNAPIGFIVKTILLKVLIGILSGFIIDFIIRREKKENQVKAIHEICEHEHCDCKDGILVSSIKHTLKIYLFIIVASFIINLIIYYVGEENIGNIFFKDSIFSSFIASLIGLIPNCGSSVIITELYLNGAINYGAMVSGLLTGSGVAILLLFRVNSNLKENLFIISLVYGIGVLSGIVIHILSLIL